MTINVTNFVHNTYYYAKNTRVMSNLLFCILNFFGSHIIPEYLLVYYNLFVGYVEKYTFESQLGGGKLNWLIQPLNAIVVGQNDYVKKKTNFIIILSSIYVVN